MNARQAKVIREQFRVAVARGDIAAQRIILAREPWAKHSVTGYIGVLRSGPVHARRRVTAYRYSR